MREAMADPEGVPSSGDVLGLVVAGGEVEDIGWLQAEAAHAMVIVAADQPSLAAVVKVMLNWQAQSVHHSQVISQHSYR